MNPWLGILLVSGLLMGAMVLVRECSRRQSWHPELSRKLIHIFMGLVCLSFPWLFKQSWPVWALAGLSVVNLAAVRLAPPLRAQLGNVLGGVQRQSWGDLLYAPSVAFVFWLAKGDPLRFCVPVLILALADAAGALIGRRYGFVQYDTDDGVKSIEGSASFFITAFFATHVPLLLWSSTGRLECLLIGVIMGILSMLVEAIAWRGLDNVFVPLATYICLVRLTPLSASELAIRIAVLLLIVCGFAYWKRLTRFTGSATIGAALVVYVSWAVGQQLWLIAPLSLLVAYTVLCRGPVSSPNRHTVHTIAWIGGTGMIWLCLSEVIKAVDAIYAYGVAYACHLGMIALAYFADQQRRRSLPGAFVKSILLGFLVLAIPYCYVWRGNPNVVKLAIYGLAMIVAAVAAFARFQPSLQCCPSDGERWTRQGLIAVIASLAAFLIITFVQPWSTSFE